MAGNRRVSVPMVGVPPYVLSYAVLLVAGQTLFAHDLYCLSGLCRPYGAKTIGVSFYPPLTQWATVVAPRRGAFAMPHQGQHNRSPLRKRWESYCTALSSPGGAAQTQKHSNILLYNTKNNGQTELDHVTQESLNLTRIGIPPRYKFKLLFYDTIFPREKTNFFDKSNLKLYYDDCSISGNKSVSNSLAMGPAISAPWPGVCSMRMAKQYLGLS